MSQAWVLGQRALREGWRTPEALLPTLFIPLFFLVVNVGQAAKIFPSASTCMASSRIRTAASTETRYSHAQPATPVFSCASRFPRTASSRR